MAIEYAMFMALVAVASMAVIASIGFNTRQNLTRVDNSFSTASSSPITNNTSDPGSTNVPAGPVDSLGCSNSGPGNFGLGNGNAFGQCGEGKGNNGNGNGAASNGNSNNTGNANPNSQNTNGNTPTNSPNGNANGTGNNR